MTLTLPANLDLDSHLETYPPARVDAFKKDILIYFLSLLYSIPSNNKDIIESNDGWVPLSSTMLAWAAKNYRQYLDYALGMLDAANPDVINTDAAIIETDNYYIVGEKSKSYRYVSRYFTFNQVQSLQISDRSLKRKIEKVRTDQTRRAKEIYPNLTKWFNAKLQIDTEKATAFIGQYKEQEKKVQFVNWMKMMHSPMQSSDYQREHGEIRSIKPILQHKASLYNIHRIQDQNYYLTVDDNIRRFHTNLTNLKSELRNFLTYDGQPLVSIDIKNSQPFLSLALFNRAFYEISPESETSGSQVGLTRTTDRFTIDTVAPEIAKVFRETRVKIPLPEPIRQGRKTIKSTSGNIISSLIMFSESPDSTTDAQKQPDFIQFFKAVISGRFYEEFEATVKEKLGKEFNSRAETKKAVFLVLFTDNQFWGQEDAAPKRVFAEVYPTVYELFRRVKATDSSALPRLLQSIESWLILDKVCPRISREKPDLPIFTIHDSILTVKGEEGYIQQVMEEEIQKYIGHKPALEVTIYSPSKVLPENS